jgi:CheY-like chemotaxis protein
MIPLKIQPADETVLVVEDEVLLRTGIAEFLRGCGYRVIETAHADEAIAVLECPGIRVEIVISGVQMRGAMNGFMLRRWVMENRPDLDVFLASTPARAMDKAADLCQAGPDAGKARAPHDVLDRIRRLLAARKLSRKSA